MEDWEEIKLEGPSTTRDAGIAYARAEFAARESCLGDWRVVSPAGDTTIAARLVNSAMARSNNTAATARAFQRPRRSKPALKREAHGHIKANRRVAIMGRSLRDGKSETAGFAGPADGAASRVCAEFAGPGAEQATNTRCPCSLGMNPRLLAPSGGGVGENLGA